MTVLHPRRLFWFLFEAQIVREKLKEFGRDTCVKLVEVSSDDPTDGGKYENTFGILRSQGKVEYFKLCKVWSSGLIKLIFFRTRGLNQRSKL